MSEDTSVEVKGNSPDYFHKYAYVVDITEKIGRIEDQLNNWKIPVKESADKERDIELEAPWNLIIGDTPEGKRKAVLQLVVSEQESNDGDDGKGFAFRPSLVATIMMKIHETQDESFLAYLFDAGYGKFYPVAYSWRNGEDEPVVI